MRNPTPRRVKIGVKWGKCARAVIQRGHGGSPWIQRSRRDLPVEISGLKLETKLLRMSQTVTGRPRVTNLSGIIAIPVGIIIIILVIVAGPA